MEHMLKSNSCCEGWGVSPTIHRSSQDFDTTIPSRAGMCSLCTETLPVCGAETRVLAGLTLGESIPSGIRFSMCLVRRLASKRASPFSPNIPQPSSFGRRECRNITQNTEHRPGDWHRDLQGGHTHFSSSAPGEAPSCLCAFHGHSFYSTSCASLARSSFLFLNDICSPQVEGGTGRVVL